MKKISLKSIVWKEEDFYVAQCINIDVSSFGKTRQEAMEKLKEALTLYFDGSSKESVEDVREIRSPELIETSFKL